MYLLSVYTMSPRKSWQTDNKRTELTITTIPIGVVILKARESTCLKNKQDTCQAARDDEG
jgi:hypothetical protein